MFGLTGVYLRIAEFAILIAFLFGAYFWVGHNAVENYKESQQIVQAQADKLQREKYESIAKDLEDLKLKRAANAKIIQKETERIVERPVYINSCWDDDGLRNANAAIRGTHLSEPKAEVPANPRD
jgi:hypothetical protein